MITTEDKYLGNIDILQNVNQPAYALLPSADKIYDISLNTRQITNPNITLVEKDHKSITLYFSVDRYLDYMDLAQTHCIIQYNVKDKTYYYPIPFYDIYTKAAERKMILPWNLSYLVTENSGTVSFSIRFFKIGTKIIDGIPTSIVTYNLNILPATLKISTSLATHKLTEEEEKNLTDGLQDLMHYVDLKTAALSKKMLWTVLEDDFNDVTIDVSESLQSTLLDIINK